MNFFNTILILGLADTVMMLVFPEVTVAVLRAVMLKEKPKLRCLPINSLNFIRRPTQLNIKEVMQERENVTSHEPGVHD